MDKFLKRVLGVVHVGANTGQEVEVYGHLGLNVIWIEPIPSVYLQLKENVKKYPNQKAFQYLITNKDNREYFFNVSNIGGVSSSILDLKLHRELWPKVTYTHSIVLNSITLDTFAERENFDPRLYDGLVLDTQGSELMVLEGAKSILSGFNYIKVEVPDFEAYEGCCRLSDIESFMAMHEFRQSEKHIHAVSKSIGTYYDIVYRRVT